MKRRLILLRHAKSSWEPTIPSDHLRPLNDRGRDDAPRVARALVDRGWQPDAVYSSDSTRTRQTWEAMAPILGDPPVQFVSALYHAGLEAIRASALGWDAGARTTMVVGHNPGWSVALQRLSGQPFEMKTGNAALLVGQGASWSAALSGSWSLEALIRPRELDD